MPETPAEKIQRANDDFHEAIEELLLSEEYTLEQKKEVGFCLHRMETYFEKIAKVLGNEQ